MLTRRCTAAIAWLALLGLPLHGQMAWGGGPPLDVESEQMIVGGKAAPTSAVAIGSWSVQPKRVAPRRPSKRFSRALWVPAGSGSSLHRGAVRFRLQASRRLDAALLVRARLTEKKAAQRRGLALRIQGRWAWWADLRGSAMRRRGDKTKLRWHKKGGELEVYFSLLGPHLVATIYHLPSGRALGRLALRLPDDAPKDASQLGLMLRGKKVVTALTLLSTRKACAKQKQTKAMGWPLVAHLALDARSKALWQSQRGKDTSQERVQTLEILEGDAKALVLRTDVLGLEQLRCSGHTIDKVTIELPWKYIDDTYLQQRNEPIEREGKLVSPLASYLSVQQIHALLRAWRQKYPRFTKLLRLGKSHQGRPLLALAIGSDRKRMARRPAMLLNGAHHGDEPMSVVFVLDAIATLLRGAESDAKVRRWLSSLTVVCVPLVNPDGYHAYTELSTSRGRKNGRARPGNGTGDQQRGVDLNRNYPFRWGAGPRGASSGSKRSSYYRGPAAGSEPEVKAMIKLAQRERFVGAISFHTGTVGLLAPYTIDGVKNPHPNEAWSIAEELIAGLQHPQRPFRVLRKLYSVDGTDQDWLRHATGALAFLLEGASFSPRKEAERKALVEAVRPIWQRLFDRLLNGPSLSLRVVDAKGRPLRAQVTMTPMRMLEGEKWTTSCRTGLYHRYLARPGRYQVTVKVAGQAPVTKEIRAAKRRVRLEIPIEGEVEAAARCR